MVNTTNEEVYTIHTYTKAKVMSVTVQQTVAGFSRMVTIDQLPNKELYFGPPVGMASDLLNILCLGSPVDITVSDDGNKPMKILGAVAFVNT